MEDLIRAYSQAIHSLLTKRPGSGRYEAARTILSSTFDTLAETAGLTHGELSDALNATIRDYNSRSNTTFVVMRSNRFPADDPTCSFEKLWSIRRCYSPHLDFNTH